MATYKDLFDLKSNTELKNRVMIACLIAANTIRTEDPVTANHANRMLWAAKVFENPVYESDRMFWCVIALNASATAAQITGATDAAIQTNVNNSVDLFATG